LCVFYKGGQPRRLDPATLETVYKELCDGSLSSVRTLSAPGKIKGKTGHQNNFGINITGLGIAGLPDFSAIDKGQTRQQRRCGGC
jgi:carotenoid cleavage dioxygenase-like enzyme